MTRPSRALIALPLAVVPALALAAAANAGPAAVVAARGKCSAKGICAFEVTVKHSDEGWKHYADRWEVVGPDGQVLATRVLQHPHIKEQPFTRTLTGVPIPASVKRVTIRARDSVHGFGGAEKTIDLIR